MKAEDIGLKLQTLRNRCGLSMRQLAAKSGVSPAMVSLMERGRVAPSLVTVQKILGALGMDLAGFFSENQNQASGPVFPRERMKSVSDTVRSYTILFPRRNEFAVEVMDEQIRPAPKRPPFETLNCDVAGYVVAGSLTLEVRGRKPAVLRPGDAFYVSKGQDHRGFATGDEPARLITVCHPPKY